MFDYIVSGGMLIDGSGAAPVDSDLAILGNQIAAIGKNLGRAEHTIDARGFCVTPGFIDIHRHGDAAAFRPDYGKAELRQGLTTVLNGACGVSLVPFGDTHREELLHYLEPITGKIGPHVPTASLAEYFSALQRVRLPLNVGMMLGNGTIRADLFGVKGFPVGALWLFGFFIIASLILHKTKFGRYTYAIGSNEEAARLSGINVDSWKVAVYTLSGFFIGMAGIFYAAAYTTITPGTGNGLEMNGITGVIIGGTSMSGGSGTMVGTLIGVFIMSVLKNGLSSCGLQAPWQTFLTGVVVIGAVLLDIARTKAANRVKKG